MPLLKKEISKFLDFVVSWLIRFLVPSFLGFLDSWIIGVLVSWFQSLEVSKIQKHLIFVGRD